MYKLPPNITPEELMRFQGAEGSYLNPIQDADGNWVVSDEEWNAAEFQYIKDEYPEITAQFTHIEFKAKIVNFNTNDR